MTAPCYECGNDDGPHGGLCLDCLEATACDVQAGGWRAAFHRDLETLEEPPMTHPVKPWTKGSLCPRHGAYPEPDCPGCGPAAHVPCMWGNCQKPAHLVMAHLDSTNGLGDLTLSDYLEQHGKPVCHGCARVWALSVAITVQALDVYGVITGKLDRLPARYRNQP